MNLPEIYPGSRLSTSTPRCNMDLNRKVSGNGVFPTKNPLYRKLTQYPINPCPTRKIICSFIIPIAAPGSWEKGFIVVNQNSMFS